MSPEESKETPQKNEKGFKTVGDTPKRHKRALKKIKKRLCTQSDDNSIQEQTSSPIRNTEMCSSPISEMTDVTDEEQSNDEMESDRTETESEVEEGSMMEEERMETKKMTMVSKEASQTISASYPNPGQRAPVEKTGWADIVAGAEGEDDTW